MFGIRITRDESDDKQGFLRMSANESGEVQSIEMASPLLPNEIGPALTRLHQELNALDKESRDERLQKVLDAARKKAGILERVSGKAQNRQVDALTRLPDERFRGESGGIVCEVSGDFAVHAIECEGIEAALVISKYNDAVEAARLIAEQAWTRAIEKEAEEEAAEKNEA